MDEPQPTLSMAIAESIRRLIASGGLKPGDRLPPVRDQARRWGCTPGTVSRAYATLTREGLVVGRRGAGTRVAPRALQGAPDPHQWAGLVNRAERFLIEALGSGFSPAQVETALSLAVARWEDLQRKPAPEATPLRRHATLRFKGSHDLVVETLVHVLAEQAAPVALTAEYVGSLGGLMALARGEADIAGAHLWDEATDTYNAPFVQRVLPGRRVALVGLAFRSLGLILPAGNPLGLRDLADLARPGLHLVNRQSGSGTRVWLDAQLKHAGLDPLAIVGYASAENTHLAVAEQIVHGVANVGVGIQAAAAAYGLDFVPLTKERYDLVVPEDAWGSLAVRSLLSILRSDRFGEQVRALGGYDASITGQEVWLN
ncbi:MAG: hypothetical protein A2Y93_18195 [Chloroflexi bacterium RBG_13_68_17]|nr:MAG: hypothetical protein A2Y93_18195 [Chloroflexi bacterium RBG_13_68_17]